MDGVYVCGLAHSPKPINEIIVQAQAASAKAAIPLVKGYVTVDPIVSNIDKDICIGCRLCTILCPYQAIQMVKDENNRPKARITSYNVCYTKLLRLCGLPSKAVKAQQMDNCALEAA